MNLAQYRKDGTITVYNGATPIASRDYLVKGDRGEDVKEMQTMLNAVGYNCGTADGVFGDKTEKALSAFRKANKMTPTPKYTEKVKVALTAAYKASTLCLKEGDKGDDVKKMQTMLNAIGYGCGKADGIFGAKTADALSRFRLAHGMTKTAKYTAKVEAALVKEYTKVV